MKETLLSIALIIGTAASIIVTIRCLWHFFSHEINDSHGIDYWNVYPVVITSISMLFVALDAVFVWPGLNALHDQIHLGTVYYVFLLYFVFATIALLSSFDEYYDSKPAGAAALLHQIILTLLVIVRFCC